MARIQPCLGKLGVNLGYYKGKEIWRRNIIERCKALFLYKIRFCLIWKSEKVSFNQAIRETKGNFKRVDKYITEKTVNSDFECIHTPKKSNLI